MLCSRNKMLKKRSRVVSKLCCRLTQAVGECVVRFVSWRGRAEGAAPCAIVTPPMGCLRGMDNYFKPRTRLRKWTRFLRCLVHCREQARATKPTNNIIYTCSRCACLRRSENYNRYILGRGTYSESQTQCTLCARRCLLPPVSFQCGARACHILSA